MHQEEFNENQHSKWPFLPESVFIEICSYLQVKDVLALGQCCKYWNEISKDGSIWRNCVKRDFLVNETIFLRPGKLRI